MPLFSTRFTLLNMMTDEAYKMVYAHHRAMRSTLRCKLPPDIYDDINYQIHIMFNSNPSSYIINNEIRLALKDMWLSF